MASKKSFILYADQRGPLSTLTDADRGRLLMALFDYVEGIEPSGLSETVLMAFLFIRAQIDRDLEKWENIREGRSEAGRRGGVASGKSRRESEANASSAKQTKQTKQTQANEAVNVNVNVNGNVNVKDNVEAIASCRASPTSDADSAREIIAFLNLTIGASYSYAAKPTFSHIKARLKEGFTVDDFKTVILRKNAEWSADPKMSRYLRPETLFGAKFESYLQQPDKPPGKGINEIFAELYHERKELETHGAQ